MDEEICERCETPLQTDDDGLLYVGELLCRICYDEAITLEVERAEEDFAAFIDEWWDDEEEEL
jgi:hypothetical protein